MNFFHSRHASNGVRWMLAMILSHPRMPLTMKLMFCGSIITLMKTVDSLQHYLSGGQQEVVNEDGSPTAGDLVIQRLFYITPLLIGMDMSTASVGAKIGHLLRFMLIYLTLRAPLEIAVFAGFNP